MRRVRIHPKESLVSSRGVWTLKMKVRPSGIPVGGGIRILWRNGAGFAPQGFCSSSESDFDIRVRARKIFEFNLTMRWLPQVFLGTEINMLCHTEILGGDTIEFIFGETGKWKTGSYPTTIYLEIYEDVRGDGLYRKIPETHALKIKSLPIKKFDVYAEPNVNKEGKTKIFLRFRDKLGNLLSFPQKTRIFMNNATFGSRKRRCNFLINPQFEKDGIARVKVRAKSNNLNIQSVSNPISSKGYNGFNLYFGEIHCHTAFSDGYRTVQDAYKYARDDVCLDFASVTDHDCHLYGYELQPDSWEDTKRITEEFNSPGNFVTILGYEWSPTVDKVVGGHHNIYFKSSGIGQLLSCKNLKAASIKGLFCVLQKRYNPGEVLVVPHHPVAYINEAGYPEPSLTVAWNGEKCEFLRLVEIYSKWGCSEGLGDFCPLRSPKKGSSVIDALKKGYKLGFAGGSDSHIAMPGSCRKEVGNLKYASSGIIGVWAREKTREAIFDALYERRCYATSGQRTVVKFSINGYIMGSEIRLNSANEARAISCIVYGIEKIKEIYIMREGKTIKSFKGKSAYEHIDWIDDSKLHGPTWYYVRIRENSGKMMWVSPIWIY